jgi:hypothetical protein
LNRPDEYAEELARVAEAKRLRRQNLSDEEKAELRSRESEAARLRRQHYTPEQKANYLERSRDAIRQRRKRQASNRSSFSDSTVGSWMPESEFKSHSPSICLALLTIPRR